MADAGLPAAEICRRLGRRAAAVGLSRPSYETVRALVRLRRPSGGEPTTKDVLLDVAMRSRPPDAFLDHVSGVGLPRR